MRKNERNGPGMLISDVLASAPAWSGLEDGGSSEGGCAHQAPVEPQANNRETITTARRQRGDFTAGTLWDRWGYHTWKGNRSWERERSAPGPNSLLRDLKDRTTSRNRTSATTRRVRPVAPKTNARENKSSLALVQVFSQGYGLAYVNFCTSRTICSPVQDWVRSSKATNFVPESLVFHISRAGTR